MNMRSQSQNEELDQSELIGLSEINFLLVVALLALVATAAPGQLSKNQSEGNIDGELVQLDTTQATKEPGESSAATSGGSALAPTHTLSGEPFEPDQQVVIAVPPDFPLEKVQFLIQRP